MGWFSSIFDAVSASKITATVVADGQPVVGAKVVRTVNIDVDKNQVDEAVTDENGYFELPKRTTFAGVKAFTHFSTRIDIKIYIQDKEYIGWGTRKNSEYNFSEIQPEEDENNNPIKMVCDIERPKNSRQLIRTDNGDGIMPSGICHVVERNYTKEVLEND